MSALKIMVCSSFLPFVETITPESRKKSETFTASCRSPPGLFLRSRTRPLRPLFLAESFLRAFWRSYDVFSWNWESLT